MMRRLHTSHQGAHLAISLLEEPETQDFISTHASILDSSFGQTPMSDAMRQSLQKSDYIFSGIKTFHELHEAFPSLLDENGNRKPFEQFLNDVRKIDEKYNRNYLRAEYNFCQQSANMASKWEQFQEDGDRYNLQYRTAGDDHVRPAHAALDRITLPPSHPFWKRYFPPNGWNCRCTVVQVRKSKYPETPDSEVEHLIGQNDSQNPKEDMFRFNPGIEKKTVPDYNPYTIRRCQECDIPKGSTGSSPLSLSRPSVPIHELCQACQMIRKCQEEREKKYGEYLRYLNDPKYKDTEYHERSGGVKATHVDHTFDEKKGWYEKKAQIAGFLNGHSVILGVEYHNIFQHRNTEGLWDGLLFEIAGAENGTANNIRNALKHCAKKPGSRIAVLFFPNDNFSAEEFNQGYSKFFGLKGTTQYKKFDLIYCITGDKNEASVPRITHIKKPSD